MSSLPIASSLSTDFPELANYSLGSLKKYARGKNLRFARIALILASILMAVEATVIYVSIDHLLNKFEKDVRAEVKKQGFFARVNEQKLAEVKTVLRRINETLSYGMYGIGAAFLLLGLLVYRFPLFCSVGGLILYIGFLLIMTYLLSRERNAIDVMAYLFSWWPAKIVIFLGLVKGIHTAVMYQRERAEQAVQEDMQVQQGV